jgi:hypothetical protein
MAESKNVFDTILTKGVQQGQMPARTQQARDWYRDVAAGTNIRSNVTLGYRGRVLVGGTSRLTNYVSVGSMYMFSYDAKHKDTLPYWDARPLIFPFRLVPGGFYGINLHYLPLQARAALMDALYDITNNTKYDDSTVVAMNYQLLMSSARTNMIKPCVKRYLTGHTKSSFLYIHPAEWDIALFLPTAKWQKASQDHVWKQSGF